jgi:hypothetical protein
MPERIDDLSAHLKGQAEFGLSKFRFYSIGIVAANKPQSTDLIEVSPVEEQPFLHGEITDHLVSDTITGQDSSGAAFTAKVKSSVSIQAKWLRCADNRLTSPNVRRGEMVMIYQFGNADTFYWTTLLTDMKLRRLETVIYGWSASPKEDDPADPDHMYFLEVSTHTKKITLHTSKSNGEPFSYDIQLNTGEGSLLVQDDIGNTVSIDSKAHRVQMTNTDGSHYDMHKGDLTITTPNTITLQSKNITIHADQGIRVTGDKAIAVSTTNLTQQASSSASLTAGSVSTSASGALTLTSGGPASMTSSASATIMSPATQLL